MSSAAPSQKVTAGSLAMTATTILIWVLNAYVIEDRPLPGEIAALIITFVGSAVTYLTPPSRRDVATTD
jgi:hypothetical protein